MQHRSGRARARCALAALATAPLVALPVAAAATEVPSDPPTQAPPEVPTEPPTAPVRLDDAVLRWGLNNESSNRAFAPGTVNLFSAGIAPEPTGADRTLQRGQWRQRSGAVQVQKWDGSRWRAATWPGLSTDSAGRPLGSPTSGTFSNHAFVFTDGRGEVDRAAGTARIAWDGEVSVLYYSGLSRFRIADPVLTVADGAGTLQATVVGTASDRDDPSQATPVAPRVVTLAVLPDVDLGEDAARGLVARPAYDGVTVRQQQGTGHVGAFPQGFVDYMGELGTAAFWHASGSSTDPFKVALPLSVSYAAAAPVADPAPVPPGGGGRPEEPVRNPVVTPPPAPAPAPAPSPAAPAALPPASAPTPGRRPTTTVAAPVLPGRPLTEVRLLAVPAVAGPASSGTRPWPWWTGTGLLLLALTALLLPAGRSAGPTRSRDH